MITILGMALVVLIGGCLGGLVFGVPAWLHACRRWENESVRRIWAARRWGPHDRRDPREGPPRNPQRRRMTEDRREADRRKPVFRTIAPDVLGA